MVDARYIRFTQRLKRIDRNHRMLERGFTTAVNHDGLLIAKPLPTEFRLTWRGVAYIIIVMMAFKVFLHAQYGPTVYQERVAALQYGTLAQQVGAFIMVADPITVGFANAFGGALE